MSHPEITPELKMKLRQSKSLTKIVEHLNEPLADQGSMKFPFNIENFCKEFDMERAVLLNDLQKTIGCLIDCHNQMQYYKDQLLDNPSSWNELMSATEKQLKSPGS